jgi:hypothetical protein
MSRFACQVSFRPRFNSVVDDGPSDSHCQQTGIREHDCAAPLKGRPKGGRLKAAVRSIRSGRVAHAIEPFPAGAALSDWVDPRDAHVTERVLAYCR